ncbi:hypothetical protein [Confluentibacter sediminis]|uniref:hypothetical protein n=1 Tax=Confluentibacter sediminis TaxID=2219045 RepID=UPI000DAE8D1E|nr:hypothetical protein [Confluentibacter sediminis]
MKQILIYFLPLLFSLWLSAQNIEYKRADAIFYPDESLVNTTAYQKKMGLLEVYYTEAEVKRKCQL